MGQILGEPIGFDPNNYHNLFNEMGEIMIIETAATICSALKGISEIAKSLIEIRDVAIIQVQEVLKIKLKTLALVLYL